jgi:acyl-CoA hydrolase
VIEDQLAAARRPPEAVLEHVHDGDDVIVGMALSEPATVLDALEAGAGSLRDVRLHQMFPLRDRPSIDGEIPGLRHVSWFLSPHDRDAFHRGACDLVPNNFGDVPSLMRRSTKCSLAIASVAPAGPHGWFSFGLNADYIAPFAGEVPFFVEVNQRMPRTFGENQVHVSQVVGWCEADYPLAELPPRESRDTDRRIAELVAERIPDGATLQIGIGSVPTEVVQLLRDHRHLGIHTELFSDGLMDLIECGAVTNVRKRSHPNTSVTTNAMGTQRLYDFLADNPGVAFLPVDRTNDPLLLAQEEGFTAVNGTLEVDFLGQCASESLGSAYWSSSGGQPDFARGAVRAPGGQSFIVLHSSTGDESVSRIVPRLQPGAAVTTFKNLVDKVVTEYGVAELRGSSIRERTERLIAIAHPKFRDELEREAREMGYLP